MAEATLKDVLAAIAELRVRVDAVDAKVDAHRAETRAELAQVRADVTAHRVETSAHRVETSAHRAETAKGFASLEDELAGHSDPIHKNLEADIRALHRPLLRAKVPGIPKDLPSQVRAKGEKAERASKPAKRTAKRR